MSQKPETGRHGLLLFRRRAARPDRLRHRDPDPAVHHAAPRWQQFRHRHDYRHLCDLLELVGPLVGPALRSYRPQARAHAVYLRAQRWPICCSPFASELWMIYAARAVAGLMAGNFPVASAMMADITPPTERAKGMGIIGAAFGLGLVSARSSVACSPDPTAALCCPACSRRACPCLRCSPPGCSCPSRIRSAARTTARRGSRVSGACLRTSQSRLLMLQYALHTGSDQRRHLPVSRCGFTQSSTGGARGGHRVRSGRRDHGVEPGPAHGADGQRLSASCDCCASASACFSPGKCWRCSRAAPSAWWRADPGPGRRNHVHAGAQCHDQPAR
jgi:hypothetical protein